MQNAFHVEALELRRLLAVNTFAAQLEGFGETGPGDVATDADGNLYVTGDFFGIVDFDPSADIENLESPFEADKAYVAKYSPEGELIWAKALDGDADGGFFGIAVDGDGNVVVAGSVELSDEDDDAIIWSLDSDGNTNWQKTFEGTGEEFANDVAVDSDGNVFLAGEFDDTIDIESEELVSKGDFDSFLAKFNVDGDLQWVKSYGGASNSTSRFVSVDSADNPIVGGYFEGKVDLDPGADKKTFKAGANNHGFVQKFNTDGELIWASRIAGREIFIYGLAVDGRSVVITGDMANKATFGAGDNAIVRESNGEEAFVAKLNRKGKFVWAGNFNGKGSGVSGAWGVAVDGDHNVVAVGFAEGRVDYNPGAGKENRTVENPGGYLVKLSPAGKFKFARVADGDSGFTFNSVAIAPNNQIYTSATFEGIFDTSELGGDELLESAGENEVLLLKLTKKGKLLA